MFEYVVVATTQVANESLVQASAHIKPTITLGGCEEVEAIISGARDFKEYEKGYMSPAGIVAIYLNRPEKYIELSGAKVTILSTPKYGKLERIIDHSDNGPGYLYTPDINYMGKDKIVWQVEVAGRKFRIVEDIVVMKYANVHDEGDPGPECFTFKRIGSVTPSEYGQPWLNSDYGNFKVTLSAIPGQSLGTTVGTTTETATNTEITLVTEHPKVFPSK